MISAKRELHTRSIPRSRTFPEAGQGSFGAFFPLPRPSHNTSDLSTEQILDYFSFLVIIQTNLLTYQTT